VHDPAHAISHPLTPGVSVAYLAEVRPVRTGRVHHQLPPMPRISLADARPGQRLVRPVATPSGVIMVQPGTELTQALIDRLQGLGINTVSVASEGGGPDGPPLEERIRQVEARFAGHEHDTWMMQLKEIVLRQLAAGAGESRG
jgi:hypothetical protein